MQKWRKTALSGIPGLFLGKQSKEKKDSEKLVDELYRQIGQLKVENDWLKKKCLTLSTKEKRSLIDWDHPRLSMTRQCELLSVSKGGLYYAPVKMDPYNLMLMDLIDRQYLKTPFYGSRKMVIYLGSERHFVNRKRVQRLMRLMDIQAIYPKRNLSKKRQDHKIYPYLLKEVKIDRPNFVWSTDITYVPVSQGFLYLVAIIDWYSRYVLSWRLSNTLDVTFCIEALEEALDKGCPAIFNTDQGSQFTSKEFTEMLLNREIRISMDGSGRVFDNIFIERLWRTVKYEEIYLKGYESCADAKEGLGYYFPFYNNERYHQSLGYKTPQAAIIQP